MYINIIIKKCLVPILISEGLNELYPHGAKMSLK